MSRIGETLEQRVVLSDWGGNLLASALNSIGVATGPVTTDSDSTWGPWHGDNSQASQLESDIQALRKELAGLAAKSGVTVADLSGLAADSQAIAQSGSHIDWTKLDAAVNELATAIAGGTSTAQAQTDFQAVFANTSVPSAIVTSAFNDLSKAITDSGVTTTDLSTVASDKAAIQKDFANLQNGDGDSDDSGSGSGGDGGSGSSSGGGSSGGTSTGGSSSGSGSTTDSGTTTPPIPTGSPGVSPTGSTDSTASMGSTSSTGSTDTRTSSNQTTNQTHTRHHHVSHAATSAVRIHLAKTQAKARHTRG